MEYMAATNINYNDVVEQLQHYMLTSETIERAMSFMVVNQQSQHCSKPKQQAARQISTMFRPREKDSLFWCFYIMVNGDVAYETLANRNMITEKKFKIEYVEKLRADKDRIKPYKFASATHIESKLANDATIDIPTFLTLCVLENQNVIFVNKRTYYELTMNNDSDVFIVYGIDNWKYGFETDVDKANNIRTTFLKLDNMAKPVKAISSYKVDELVEMCTRLSIETHTSANKPKSKMELYESIVKYF